jgi:hypothetical protein
MSDPEYPWWACCFNAVLWIVGVIVLIHFILKYW